MTAIANQKSGTTNRIRETISRGTKIWDPSRKIPNYIDLNLIVSICDLRVITSAASKLVILCIKLTHIRDVSKFLQGIKPIIITIGLIL